MDGKRTVDVCLSPVLFPYYRREGQLCVVVDVFRATTCMCAGLAAGVEAIVPVAGLDEARRLKEAGYTVAAERNVARCDFADLGNSPFDYMSGELRGRVVVMTTTNGTQAIEAAHGCDCIVAGAFVNLSRVAAFCRGRGQDVMVLCAGWNNRMNAEDTLFGGAFVDRLLRSGRFVAASDAATAALSLWQRAQDDLRAALRDTEHVRRLQAHGLQRDIDFCLTLDAAPVLPLLDNRTGRLVRG